MGPSVASSEWAPQWGYNYGPLAMGILRRIPSLPFLSPHIPRSSPHRLATLTPLRLPRDWAEREREIRTWEGREGE